MQRRRRFGSSPLQQIAFLGLFVINLGYHVLCKPTEMFAFVSNEFNKAPVETWRQYGRLFHKYSTAAISPDCLQLWRKWRGWATRSQELTGAGS
jgi:hypothetical protein